MITIPDYRRATNMAYEVLAQYEDTYPVIDIYRILQLRADVCVHTYSEIASREGVSTYEFAKYGAPSEQGFTIERTKKRVSFIAYNDLKDDRINRFTLAHELGHIVLGHSEDSISYDREANCFARNLLCPLPLRIEMQLQTADEYCNMFEVTKPMAEATIGLLSADLENISGENYERIKMGAYRCLCGRTSA